MIERTPSAPPPTSGMRCAYAAYLAAVVGTVAFAALATGEGDGRLLAPAVLSGLLAWLLRSHLEESGTLAACEAEDAEPVAVTVRAADGNAAHHQTLLGRAAALERLRGTAAFDPWEYQELRRQLLERDPATR